MLLILITNLRSTPRTLAELDEDNKQILRDEIAKQQKRKDQYKKFEKEPSESGEPQISTSDPENRQIMIRNNITEAAYNVQTTVFFGKKVHHGLKKTLSGLSFFRGPFYTTKYEVALLRA
jgi:hypothetical protein